MSQVTVEQLQENIDQVLASIGDEKMCNWDVVEQTENELMKHFDQLSEKLHALKEGSQRVFLTSIKNIRQYDAKDLCQKVKDKKLEPTVLKSLAPYAHVNEEGKYSLNISLIKGQVNGITLPWVAKNRTIIDKITEMNEWLDEQLEQMDYFKQKDQKQDTVSKQEEKKDVVSIDGKDGKNFRFKSEKLNDIASQIQVMHIPNTKDMISIKTYTQIVEGSVELAENEFIRLTQENRQFRREILYSDAQKYVNMLMDYVNDIENLLMKAQEEICGKIDISQQILEQSEMLLMERGLGQHVFMLQASARQKIKDKLPKQKQVQMSATKEIIKYQIKLLKEKQDFLKNVLDKLPNSYEAGQLVPMVLNLVMGDMIYEEYSYEEEDYLANLENPNLFQDLEVMELLKGIEQGVVALLGKTNFAQPPMQGMPQGMPSIQGMQQMMGMPGMFPPQ